MGETVLLLLSRLFLIGLLLSGSDEIQKNMDEFQIKDYGVSCHGEPENPHRFIREDGVATFSRVFLIGSSSYLQVTMTYIRIWISSKVGQII